MRQVITVRADGGVEGLQMRPGKGFDLRKLGAATITRASEIVWDETKQAWFVQIADGQWKGEVIGPKLMSVSRVDMTVLNAKMVDGTCAWFEEYDEAVKFEIAVLDGLRLRSLL